MQQTPQDIKQLSQFLDSKFGIGGFRFGWDGILGFIPFVGDFITNGASLYILLRAAALGCSPSVLLRMGGNILVDNLLDFIPVLGNLFDFVWQSNSKNLVLLDRYLRDPQRTTRASRWVVWLTVLFVVAMMLLLVVAAFFFLKWLWSYIAPMVFSETGWEI